METPPIRNQQSIHDGKGPQVNDPQASVVIGDGNTVNVYKGTAPQTRPALTGTPNNLPYSGATVFVGREKALEELHKQLQQGQTVAISAISGMGGIGKTELAWQYADRHRETETYPGGICWLRAREEVGTQILGFARSCLNLDPPMEGELESRVRWCWQRWRAGDALIVFDDVQKFDEIRSFLPPRESRFKVLMTSRSRFGSLVQTYEIPMLDEASSLKLLGAIVSVEAIDAELETAKQVCEWLGYLPLALELVGRYLARRRDTSVATLWERLQQKRLDAIALKQVNPEMTGALGVAAAFELSWQELDEKSQRMAAFLGLFALAPIPWEWVESALSEWDEEDLQEARSTLVDFSLITELETGWYELHPLLRLFFALKLPESKGAQEWKQALCRVAVRVCQQIEQSLTIHKVQELLPIIPHLEVVAQTLAQDYCEDDDLDWAFVGVARFYNGQGLYQQAEEWYENCLRVVRDRFGSEHLAIATSLNNLAGLYRVQGRYGEAELLYQQALTIRQQQLGTDHPAVATSLNNLAGLYRVQGRYDEAEPLYQEALALRQQLLGSDHPDVATSLNNLAALYESQGRYSEAEPLYQHALALLEQLLGPDHPNVATSLNNLAALYESQGRHSEAEPLYQHVLALRQQLLGSDHPDVATSLNNLALLYKSQGRNTEAEPLYLEALEIDLRCFGDTHPSVALDLNNLAELYSSQQRYREAESLFQQALAIQTNIFGELHPLVVNSLESLANFYYFQNRYNEAESLLIKALEIKQENLGVNYQDNVASLSLLASLYVLKGDFTRAEETYQAAINLVQLGENKAAG